MSTQGVGTFAINAFWESGRLIYYEKASGHTTTGNVFILGADYVQVGDTANDVNFLWKGTTTGTFTLDAGAHTFAMTGMATSTDGALTITNATATSSTTTGALIVTGGIATAADITCGDDLFMSNGGVINFNAGNLTLTHSAGTLTNSGILVNTGAISVDDTTDSTSTTSGSIQTDGGLGVAKDIYAGDDIFLTSGAVLNFNAGNVTLTHSAGTLTNSGILVNTGAISVDDTTASSSTATGSIQTDGGLGVAGAVYIGGAVDITVATAGLTTTCATLNATAGRVGKFVGSIAAGNLGDGYGAVEIDVTASGTLAGHVSAASSWVNIADSAVTGIYYVCAQTNGVYEATGTLTNTKIVFGMRMSQMCTNFAVTAGTFPFSINTNNNGITALFDVATATDMGDIVNAGGDSGHLIPIFRDNGGNLRYVKVYTAV